MLQESTGVDARISCVLGFRLGAHEFHSARFAVRKSRASRGRPARPICFRSFWKRSINLAIRCALARVQTNTPFYNKISTGGVSCEGWWRERCGRGAGMGAGAGFCGVVPLARERRTGGGFWRVGGVEARGALLRVGGAGGELCVRGVSWRFLNPARGRSWRRGGTRIRWRGIFEGWGGDG